MIFYLYTTFNLCSTENTQKKGPSQPPFPNHNLSKKGLKHSAYLNRPLIHGIFILVVV